MTALTEKMHGPENDQAAYDLGYDNPAVPARQLTWRHLVFVNAYASGQADRQNQQPRNTSYRPEQYDPETFELKLPWEASDHG